MEFRYYIIFAIAIISLQLFITIFNRTLQWLFTGKLSQRGKKYLIIIIFALPNALWIG